MANDHKRRHPESRKGSLCNRWRLRHRGNRWRLRHRV